MGGSDGAFGIYLRTFRVREELEAKAKKEAEQSTNAKPLTITKLAQHSGDEKAGIDFPAPQKDLGNQAPAA